MKVQTQQRQQTDKTKTPDWLSNRSGVRNSHVNIDRLMHQHFIADRPIV